MWVSGTGIARDFAEVTGRTLTTREIAAAGDADAAAAMERFVDRLARGLAVVVNALDPDVILIGGGVSRVARIYEELPRRMKPWVFGGDFDTPVRMAEFGDSSGVRGAAWLWPE